MVEAASKRLAAGMFTTLWLLLSAALAVAQTPRGRDERAPVERLGMAHGSLPMDGVGGIPHNTAAALDQLLA